MKSIVARTKIKGYDVQASIHYDKRSHGNSPFELLLLCRECDTNVFENVKTEFDSMEEAQTYARERFTIKLGEWTDGFDHSTAVKKVEASSAERDFQAFFIDDLTGHTHTIGEAVVAAATQTVDGEEVILEIGDTLICASLKVNSGVIVDILHRSRLSTISPDFPRISGGAGSGEFTAVVLEASEDSSVQYWSTKNLLWGVFAWKGSTECSAMIEALDLGPDEEIQIASDSICMVFDADRDIVKTVDALVALSRTLPE